VNHALKLAGTGLCAPGSYVEGCTLQGAIAMRAPDKPRIFSLSHWELRLSSRLTS
jgi:hypothetical protein